MVTLQISKAVKRHPDVGFLAGRTIKVREIEIVQTQIGPAAKFSVKHNGGEKNIQILSDYIFLISH